MRICSIASGSSGNCTYVGNGDTNILIDAGVSRKRIVEGLKKIGVAPEQLNGIFVTHEHSDHIQGINMMVKMFDTPVYATGGTLDSIRLKDKKGVISMNHLFEVHADEPVSMGEITVMPFSTSHDAADPVGYTLTAEGHKASIATDLGKYDEYIISHLKNTEVLFIEANHDISMLEAGSYPYSLKRRILSEYGHLSNEAAGKTISYLLKSGLKNVMLGHLSKENNFPELAYQTVIDELCVQNFNENEIKIGIANRSSPSSVVNLEG